MHQLNLYLGVYDYLTSSVIRWPKRADELFVQHLVHFSFVKQIKHFPKKNLPNLRISLSIHKFVIFDLLLFILTHCNSFFIHSGSLITIVSQPSKCLKFMTFREGCFVICN